MYVSALHILAVAPLNPFSFKKEKPFAGKENLNNLNSL